MAFEVTKNSFYSSVNEAWNSDCLDVKKAYDYITGLAEYERQFNFLQEQKRENSK